MDVIGRHVEQIRGETGIGKKKFRTSDVTVIFRLRNRLNQLNDLLGLQLLRNLKKAAWSRTLRVLIAVSRKNSFIQSDQKL